MPKIVRLGDMCTGHGSFSPRASTSASADVYVEGKPVVRVGDSWGNHCDPNSCHEGVSATGSSTVFANSKPVCRDGDKVDCGSIMTSESITVEVN